VIFYVCSKCHVMQAHDPDKCPFCGAAVEQWQDAEPSVKGEVERGK